jgi:hypothetical protein
MPTPINVLHSERAIIGRLIMSPAMAPQVRAMLRPDQVSDPLSRAAYQAILSRADAGLPVDLTLLRHDLDSRMTGPDAVDFLLTITDFPAPVEHLPQHVFAVLRHAKSEAIRAVCAKALFAGNIELDGDEIQAGIAEVSRQYSGEVEKHFGMGWTEAMYDSYLSPDYPQEQGTQLIRADGIGLLYPGRVHSIHGESESGKSWIACVACVQALKRGDRTLYIDYESDAKTIASRLIALGATEEEIRASFGYVHPEAPPEGAEFEALISKPAKLVVIDSASESLATMEGESKCTDSITDWAMRFPRRVAKQSGAAVIVIDHVSKNKETRGRFAIGSQAKMATLDGAAYVCEPLEAIAPGRRGVLALRIAKDRPGSIRRACPGFDADRLALCAHVVLDSSGEGTRWEVTSPAAGEAAILISGKGEIVLRVKKALEAGPRSKRDLSKDVGESRQVVDEVVDLMRGAGMVSISYGARNAHVVALIEKKEEEKA